MQQSCTLLLHFIQLSRICFSILSQRSRGSIRGVLLNVGWIGVDKVNGKSSLVVLVMDNVLSKRKDKERKGKGPSNNQETPRRATARQNMYNCGSRTGYVGYLKKSLI